jgi:hypothetical protein
MHAEQIQGDWCLVTLTWVNRLQKIRPWPKNRRARLVPLTTRAKEILAEAMEGREMTGDDWHDAALTTLGMFVTGSPLRAPGPHGEQQVDRSFMIWLVSGPGPVTGRVPANDWVDRGGVVVSPPTHGEGRYMPRFPVPDGHDETSWFLHEVEEGLKMRYPQGINPEVRQRADYESEVIINKVKQAVNAIKFS